MHKRFAWPRIALIVVALVGCSGDAVLAPAVNPESLYWNLRVDQHAVQLSMTAPGDSLRVTAMSLTPSGAPWAPADPASAPPVVWTSSDSSKVTVSATGLIRARAVAGTSVVRVIASRQINNVTRADTVQVRVISETTPKVLTTFEVRPLDSVWVASGASRLIPIRALDQDGDVMNGAIAYVTVADTTIARIVSWTAGSAATTMQLSGRRLGSVLVTAAIWVYGVVKTDTFTVKVGYPITAYPTISQRPQPNGSAPAIYLASDSIEIGPGGNVAFSNYSGANGIAGQPIDVIFSDSSAALAAVSPNTASGTGNIIGIPTDTTIVGTADNLRRNRRFVTPGVYTYTIQPYNLHGTIVVRPNE